MSLISFKKSTYAPLMYKSLILKHAPKYFTGTIVPSVLTMAMTKYYTWAFEPAAFGILTLYIVMFKYTSILFSLDLQNSSTRYYFDYRETRRDEYLSTIFWFISILICVGLLIGWMISEPVSTWISPDSKSFYLVTLMVTVFSVYASFLLRILYNENQSDIVMRSGVLTSISNHLISFLLISVAQIGILGRLLGQGLSYLVNLIYLGRRFSKKDYFQPKWIFNKSMLKETLLLTTPSLISALLSIAFLYVDRFFLQHYLGDTAVGVYSLGFVLGQGLSMVYNAISNAILPKVFNDMNEDFSKGLRDLENFSFKYFFGLLGITLIISLLSPVIVSFFSNEDYSGASVLLPFIMIGFMMGGYYKIPALTLGFKKVVWFYPVLGIVAFASNAFLNWYFIPRFGMVGSAYASFIGTFIYSLLLQFFSFRFHTKNYKNKILLLYIIILISVTAYFYG